MTPDRSRLFGADLRLRDTSGALDLTRAGGGDLDLVQGDDAVIQALRLRLVVRRGELTRLGWPDYGSRLHEVIGTPRLARTQARLMAYARAAIEADPRVSAVLDIRASVPPGEPNVVRLDMVVQLITEPTPRDLVHDVRMDQP